MAYVRAIHDRCPHDLELSKKGYNAFSIIYRPEAETDYEDLARAIAFIFRNKEAHGVSIEGYSLWGGNAGGRMAAALSLWRNTIFGNHQNPQNRTRPSFRTPDIRITAKTETRQCLSQLRKTTKSPITEP